MQANHYGGQSYPANVIVVNPDLPPERNEAGKVDRFYDFNNTYWYASDVETRYKALKRENGGKAVTVWLLNLDNGVKASIKADYQHVWTTGKQTLDTVWGIAHLVPQNDEPEITTLLVHEQDYIAESREV